MLDPDGFIKTWNAGAQRFKGYTANEIIGAHCSVFYTETGPGSRSAMVDPLLQRTRLTVLKNTADVRIG
jgi:PAS domain-containing protein